MSSKVTSPSEQPKKDEEKKEVKSPTPRLKVSKNKNGYSVSKDFG